MHLKLSARSLRTLIVNADDFGLTQEVSRGILHAHQHGIVTSTSLMVRQEYAAEAARLSADAPRLSVGLHFDIGEWIFRDGAWVEGYRVVSPQDEQGVREEARRQLARFRDLMGQDPTHVDSHQHVHREAGPVRSVLTELSQSLGVPLRHSNPAIAYSGVFFGQGRDGTRHPELLTVDSLIRILRNLPEGTTELACHPGWPDGLVSDYREERALELSTLCDPRVRRTIEETGIRLASFAGVSDHASE